MLLENFARNSKHFGSETLAFHPWCSRRAHTLTHIKSQIVSRSRTIGGPQDPSRFSFPSHWAPCEKCITYGEGWRLIPDSWCPMSRCPDALCLMPGNVIRPQALNAQTFPHTHTDSARILARHDPGICCRWAIKICRRANKCRPYPQAKKQQTRRGKTNRKTISLLYLKCRKTCRTP